MSTAEPTTKLIQPNAQNQYKVTRRRSAAVVPHARHVPVEFASARVPADREDRLGEVPVLQCGVHVAALKRA